MLTMKLMKFMPANTKNILAESENFLKDLDISAIEITKT